MSEYKNLLKRDRIFLLCLIGVVMLILFFGLKDCYQSYCAWFSWGQEELELILGHSIEQTSENDAAWEIFGMIYSDMIGSIFGIVLLAVIIKWAVLEGKKGEVFQKLLPIKARTYLTYDYLCGMVFIWIPILFSAMVIRIFDRQFPISGVTDMADGTFGKEVLKLLLIYSTLYCLVVFAKKITGNIPAALLSAFLIFIAVLISVDLKICNLDVWDWYDPTQSDGYLCMIPIALILIMLSYWCDRKRDLARNGWFSFRPVHIIMVLLAFYDMAGIFYNCEIAFNAALNIVLSILLAGVISVGFYYLTSSKSL
jgi:hypothetical protein